MIKGFVSSDGVPAIRLSVAAQDWVAIIDTGFNGDLELPEALRVWSNPLYVGRLESSLAGGQTIEEEVYLVDFPFDGRMVQAEASYVSDAQILIGTRLLREYHLDINFWGKTVGLERVTQSA